MRKAAVIGKQHDTTTLADPTVMAKLKEQYGMSNKRPLDRYRRDC